MHGTIFQKMNCVSVFLLFGLLLAFTDVNGHKTEINHSTKNLDQFVCGRINDFCSSENELPNQDEVFWTSRSSLITLQPKEDTAQGQKLGRTTRLYHSARSPPKKIDKTLRRRSGYVHRAVKKKVSGADKRVRKGTLFAHHHMRRGVVGLDRGLTLGTKVAHRSLRRGGHWLDKRLTQGTKRTHHTVKHTTISLDKGIAQGSTVAYGTLRKGVAAMDAKLQNGVRALDKRLTGGVSGVPLKFFLNRFVNSEGKKSSSKNKIKNSSSPTLALPPPLEPEPIAEEIKPSSVESNIGMPEEVESFTSAGSENSTPPPTPISSIESNRSDDLESHTAMTEPNHYEEKSEQKADHLLEEEEPKFSDMDDDNNHFDDAKDYEDPHHEESKLADLDHEDPKLDDYDDFEDFDKEVKHDAGSVNHHENESQHQHTDDVRTVPVSKNRNQWNRSLNSFRNYNNSMRQLMAGSLSKSAGNLSRSIPRTLPKNIPPSLTKITSRSVSKINVPKSLSKVKIPQSLSRMNMSSSQLRMKAPKSLSRINMSQTLKSAPRSLSQMFVPRKMKAQY